MSLRFEMYGWDTRSVSTWPQIVVDEAQLARFRAAADRAGTTLSECVQDARPKAARSTESGDVGTKLDEIEAASTYEFPAPDVDEMLAEIDRGASM